MEAMLIVGDVYCDQQNRIWTTHMIPAQYTAESFLLLLQDKTEEWIQVFTWHPLVH